MSNAVFPLSAIGAKIVSREPYGRTRVDLGAGGKEARSSYLSSLGLRYKVAVEVLRADTRLDFQQFLSHFERHFGELDSFLIQDEEDYTVTDHGFGVGDGSKTTFQLQRSMLGTLAERGTGGPYATSSKPRTNRCIRSQEFDNASWTIFGSTAITADAAVAPDGTKTADKLAATVASGSHAVHNTAAITVATTSPVTVSFYIHAVGASATENSGEIGIYLGGSPFCGAQFDLAASSVTVLGSGYGYPGTCTGVLTRCSGGWYRCEITFTPTGTSLEAWFGPANSANLGVGQGVYLWGAQVEQASASTKYIPTTTTAVTYPSGAAEVAAFYWPSYTGGFSPVDEPDLASISIYKDGVLKTLTTDYSVSATGLVTMASPPAAAAVLSWTGNYYKRVRFEGAGMALQRLGSRMWQIPTIDLVSVRSVT